jgi:hypothetical protein
MNQIMGRDGDSPRRGEFIALVIDYEIVSIKKIFTPFFLYEQK